MASLRKGLIADDTIHEIRERTDIVQVIGNFVELKRSGTNFKGRCPFHDEKTPSFYVNTSRQFFHCFGCGASGDVFSFLSKIEGRNFGEVAADLASRAGIDVKPMSDEESRHAAQKRSDRQQALDLNRRVAQLYQRALTSPAGELGRKYIVERKLGPEITQTFELGFAPASGDIIVRSLAKHNIPAELGVQLGLIAPRRTGEGHFDRFWNRLIFPLISVQGDVIGFGGRLLGTGDGPKYVNTPETLLYRKGESLYGLYQARTALRQKDFALLVEGNIDVLQLHQSGFTQAVAPMGTALTEQQARLIARFTTNAVAVFDGDDAGRAAARRAIPILLEAGIDARIATVPRGEDPDSLIVKHGAPALQQCIDTARPAIDYFISDLRGEQTDAPMTQNSPTARAKLLEQVVPLVRKLPSAVAQDLYVDKLSHMLQIDRPIIERAMRGHGQSHAPARRIAKPATAMPSDDVPLPQSFDRIEVETFTLLIEHPHLFPRAEKKGLKELFNTGEVRQAYDRSLLLEREHGTIKTSEMLDALDTRLRHDVVQLLNSGEIASVQDATQALDDHIAKLQQRRLQSEQAAIRKQIAQAEDHGDGVTVRTLSVRLVEVDRELHGAR